MREIHLVAAARPNLPKLAALWHALAAAPGLAAPVLLHTGQHHDPALFGGHLAELGLPEPAIALGVAGGGHAELTGRTMIAAEAAWRARRPWLVVVAGDVDGTLAAALAARKLALPVAHLEAGLRSGEADLPEEINRRAVDAVATLLWAPDPASAARLLAEGHPPAAVRAVGNTMIDTLRRLLPEARRRRRPAGAYGVVTLHRGGNVDERGRLALLLDALGEAATRLPLHWPVHPRTARRMAAFGFAPPPGVTALPPLAYTAFLALLDGARVVITDSGGVQEEATDLGVPCLTLRAATERPLTLSAGTNRLVAPEELAAALDALPAAGAAAEIPLWDGEAGRRIVAHLAEWAGAWRGC